MNRETIAGIGSTAGLVATIILSITTYRALTQADTLDDLVGLTIDPPGPMEVATGDRIRFTAVGDFITQTVPINTTWTIVIGEDLGLLEKCTERKTCTFVAGGSVGTVILRAVPVGRMNVPSSAEVSIRILGPKIPLGCFDREGHWMEDREKCDPDQARHMKGQEIEVGPEQTLKVDPPLTTKEPEEVVEERMDERYLGLHHTEKQKQEVVTMIGNILDRLTNIRDELPLSPEGKMEVDLNRTRLVTSLENIDRGLATKDSLEATVNTAKALIAQTSSRIQKEGLAMKDSPDITDIFSQTELLLTKFRRTLQILKRQGIAINAALSAILEEAEESFTHTQKLCMDEEERCKDLESVLMLLSNAQNPLNALLNEHPEVRTIIEETFE